MAATFSVQQSNGQPLNIGDPVSWYSWRYKTNIIGNVHRLVVREDGTLWAKVIPDREHIRQVRALRWYPGYIVNIKVK